MNASAYLPFLIQAVLAAALTGGVIAASHLLGQRFKPNKIKDSAYECGVPAEGVIHTRFSVKFYLTALLFMLFDLEIGKLPDAHIEQLLQRALQIEALQIDDAAPGDDLVEPHALFD